MTSERPHCLNRDACAAKRVGRHCRSCATIAHNKSPEMRAVSTATARKHLVLSRPDVVAKRRSPEASMKREAARAKTLGLPFDPNTSGQSARSARRKKQEKAKMASDTSVTQKVRSMCGYISDDAWIARYIGITQKEVARIRANAPKGERARGAPRKFVVGEAGGVDVIDLQSNAVDGSRRLFLALVRYARRHHPESDLARLAA